MLRELSTKLHGSCLSKDILNKISKAIIASCTLSDGFNTSKGTSQLSKTTERLRSSPEYIIQSFP